ncbi:hypothetical protein [Arthrobacter polaris]|uniref:hypothetical protein n=1 Tax=Arthrobacter polaris TaxID=2813727 RepID=UPI001F3F5368|nr:hypothetical protein [Arthrobacter polaris]UIK88652.1 hypothetical protein J0916_15220 [Arthrobacter polaris]
MNYSMAGGFAAHAGPSPEAVAVVAQRLAGVGQEIDALRLQLDQLASTDWSSPAAAAFRESLLQRNLAFASVVRDVGAAAVDVANYGLYLQSIPAGGLSPDGPQGAGFGTGYGGGWGALDHGMGTAGQWHGS